ncbi:protein NETWORKED 3C-like [Phalaenopsis equestris]|uniref:protein NETWORKED 3C-like n=1 Tax=Phalaenopsis equestris TaxID=78828 RepID=UPI0009E25088|nr:protein NETWORKED 3C-like [Phalaenopsis equestris]
MPLCSYCLCVEFKIRGINNSFFRKVVFYEVKSSFCHTEIQIALSVFHEGMEEKMAGLKKVSHCWWFESHNSAKRSSWLQSTLSELEKKTKAILNLIEGDADSFAQRAEMYYRKRPELVNLIEDFYRSYRYVAEQHELLRSEAGARRTTPLKSDSSNQSISQKTWDSTEIDDYPESEVSEIDNPEPEEADQIDCMFVAANEEFEIIRRNLEAKSPAPPLLISQIQTKINSPEVPVKIYSSKKIISYSFHESEHQDEIKLMEAISPSNSLSSKKRDKESDDCKADELETKALFEKIVDSVAKLTSEVESLKTEKETLMAELERKDEEKRDVIRQLSLTVEILKEENGVLKKLIKDLKQFGSVFELKKWKEAFSGTRRLFGLASRFQPSLVAL